MPFDSNFLNVSVLPHTFARMDSQTKRMYREKYKTLKKGVILDSLTTAGVIDGRELVKDLISCKLKAHAYKALFTFSLGPIISAISIPMYVITYGTKFSRLAIAASSIGAKIIKGEMGIANCCWVGLYIVLFGESVSITEDSNLMIFSNETAASVCEVLGE